MSDYKRSLSGHGARARDTNSHSHLLNTQNEMNGITGGFQTRLAGWHPNRFEARSLLKLNAAKIQPQSARCCWLIWAGARFGCRSALDQTANKRELSEILLLVRAPQSSIQQLLSHVWKSPSNKYHHVSDTPSNYSSINPSTCSIPPLSLSLFLNYPYYLLFIQV